MNNKNVRMDNPDPFPFPFYSVRNISSPDDLVNNRKIYMGYTTVPSILSLPVEENVREYIVDAGLRRKTTSVHRAILDTLKNRPDEFSVLNNGITLVARECEVDDKKKQLYLTRPSIIDGAQTQGVVRDFYNSRKSEGQLSLFENNNTPYIKYEVIVTEDEDIIAEVSIARNYQNDVRPISIVGKRRKLDELDERFRQTHPHLQLRKKETDVPTVENNFVETERLFQVIAALVPEELWVKSGEFNKVYTYSQKAKCLKDFEQIYDGAKNELDSNHEKCAELYNFYLDIVGLAYDLYSAWKNHSGFKGTRLRAINRDERGEILEVPDGIIFPILASLSAFATKLDGGRWTIHIPPNTLQKLEKELIDTAKDSYIEIADSNPNVMGKSKACYSSLARISSIYKRLA